MIAMDNTHHLRVPEESQPPPAQTKSRRLPSPPFIRVDGMHNFRDCGGYPIADQPGKMVRRGTVYRSANPSKITAKGIAQLQALRVAKVFDLRSALEIQESTKKGFGHVKVWDGAVRIPVSVFTDDFYASGHHRQVRDQNLRKLENGFEGYVEYYRSIADAAVSATNPFQPLKVILDHLGGSKEPEPILIHCSLGKDRTGVICALVLSLCGVEDGIVAQEYALTALGIEEKVASIIAEIRPDGPGITAEEERFFGAA